MIQPRRDIPVCILLLMCFTQFKWYGWWMRPICTSCLRLCYVRPVLFLTLCRNNIPLCKFLKFPIVFVYRENTGTAVSKRNTLFLSAALLVTIGRTESHPGRLDVTAPISDSSPMLWKHGCLFFPPPDWHWSWLMFSCIRAVINFGLVSQTDRQMGFVVHAGLLKSKYTLGHTCSHC